jgi:hypothetical protein
MGTIETAGVRGGLAIVAFGSPALAYAQAFVARIDPPDQIVCFADRSSPQRKKAAPDGPQFSRGEKRRFEASRRRVYTLTGAGPENSERKNVWLARLLVDWAIADRDVALPEKERDDADVVAAGVRVKDAIEARVAKFEAAFFSRSGPEP